MDVVLPWFIGSGSGSGSMTGSVVVPLAESVLVVLSSWLESIICSSMNCSSVDVASTSVVVSVVVVAIVTNCDGRPRLLLLVVVVAVSVASISVDVVVVSVVVAAPVSVVVALGSIISSSVVLALSAGSSGFDSGSNTIGKE